ncbi:MAG: NADH-quinone oxidoreductase subunit NuoK [Anaplasmataceae bacterium]|nr:NADH-quinone oxidoreductase subunit NuoK [Anaplasmataceae bacterium]
MILHYLILSVLLFLVGLTGLIINRKNLLLILMSVEIMILAANFNFVSFSVVNFDIEGQIYSLFVLASAAVEASIGLAIVLLYFRQNKHIEVENINSMKG